MRYLAKLMQHPEYREQLTVVFGTDDPAQISEDDARLFFKYIRPNWCSQGGMNSGTDAAGDGAELVRTFSKLNKENQHIISVLLAALLSGQQGTPSDPV